MTALRAAHRLGSLRVYHFPLPCPVVLCSVKDRWREIAALSFSNGPYAEQWSLWYAPACWRGCTSTPFRKTLPLSFPFVDRGPYLGWWTCYSPCTRPTFFFSLLFLLLTPTGHTLCIQDHAGQVIGFHFFQLFPAENKKKKENGHARLSVWWCNDCRSSRFLLTASNHFSLPLTLPDWL